MKIQPHAWPAVVVIAALWLAIPITLLSWLFGAPPNLPWVFLLILAAWHAANTIHSIETRVRRAANAGRDAHRDDGVFGYVIEACRAADLDLPIVRIPADHPNRAAEATQDLLGQGVMTIYASHLSVPRHQLRVIVWHEVGHLLAGDYPIMMGIWVAVFGMARAAPVILILGAMGLVSWPIALIWSASTAILFAYHTFYHRRAECAAQAFAATGCGLAAATEVARLVYPERGGWWRKAPSATQMILHLRKMPPSGSSRICRQRDNADSRRARDTE